jgi:hypothetical protein
MSFERDQYQRDIYGKIAVYFEKSNLNWEEKLDILNTLVCWSLANMCVSNEQKQIVLDDFVRDIKELSFHKVWCNCPQCRPQLYQK